MPDVEVSLCYHLIRANHRLTRDFRHPTVSFLTEELAFGWQVLGIVQSAVKDIDKVTGIGLIQSRRRAKSMKGPTEVEYMPRMTKTYR